MRSPLFLCLLALASAASSLAALPDPERAELQLVAEPAWDQALDAALTGAPLSVGGGLVLPLESALEFRSETGGALVWRREELAGALAETRSVAPGGDAPRLGLALAGTKPRFVMLDPSKGVTLAETPLPAAPTAPPTALPAGAKATGISWLVPVETGRVLGLDGTGQIVTRYELGEALRGSPALILGFPVAWLGDPARLVTLEGQRAGRRVSSPRGEAARSAGRWLAAPAEPGALRAWKCRERRGERLRCKRRWTQRMGGRVLGRPLVSEERIVAGSLDTYVYAFRPRNGHQLWRTSVGHRVGKDPLAWDDYLAVVGEGRAEIVFLDALDGRVVGRIDGGSASRSETCTTRPARAGELLVAPILETPGSGPTLKAWRIRFEKPAPPPPPPPPPTSPESTQSEEP